MLWSQEQNRGAKHHDTILFHLVEKNLLKWRLPLENTFAVGMARLPLDVAFDVGPLRLPLDRKSSHCIYKYRI